MPNVFSRGEADMTDERIAHILSEASHLMKSSQPGQDPDTRSNEDSKSPNRGQVCDSKYSIVYSKLKRNITTFRFPTP